MSEPDPFDAFVVDSYVSTTPTDGNKLLYMFVYDGDPTYAEVGTNVCPAPGRRMELRFKWMVRTDEDASCGATGVPNWFNVRMQPHPDPSTVLWHKAWADVCPLLVDSGDSFQTTTGWQEAVVEFEAPLAPSTDDQRLVFTVGGYSAAGWVGLLDEVQLTPLDDE